MAEDKGRSEDEKLRSLDDDADLLGEEPRQDVLFQIQMGAANLFLGYWKVLLYIAGGVLLVAAAYGGWDSHNTSTQQAGHEGVARAERALDDIQPDMTDEEANAVFAEVAKEIEAAAAATTGPAQAFAYVRAAQFWMQVDDQAAARKAWSKAAAVGAPGAIGWTASMGAARAAAQADEGAAPLPSRRRRSRHCCPRATRISTRPGPFPRDTWAADGRALHEGHRRPPAV